MGKTLAQHRQFAAYHGGTKSSLADLAHELLACQKEEWPQLRSGYDALDVLRERAIGKGAAALILQHNPHRIISTTANVEPASIAVRPCFLCRRNLPVEQQAILYRREWLILCNPFPIAHFHFTIAHREHIPQSIDGVWLSCLRLARDFGPSVALLYNGPACGASAPDHLHFQSLPKVAIPALQDGEDRGKRELNVRSCRVVKTMYGERSAMIVEGKDASAMAALLKKIMVTLQRVLQQQSEPMINLFCLHREGTWRVILFPRAKHRPDAYYKSGIEQIIISPGAVDMGGLLVVPREEDFLRLDTASIGNLYREVACPEQWIDAIIEAL